MKDLLKFYEEYKNKVGAYNLACSQMYFDESTIAPQNGKNYTNNMLSILAGESFAYETDPENIKKLEELYSKAEGELKKEVGLLLEDLEEVRTIPKDEFIAIRKAIADGETNWHIAKEKSDYEIFKPYLKEVIAKQKLALSYSPKHNTMSDYDILLDKFQKGTSQKMYDEFFNRIKTDLIPLIKKVKEASQVDDSILNTKFDIEKQAALAEDLQKYLQVNKDECYMGTTEHPFTTFFSCHDVRITTHYYEDALMSAIFSLIHEYGHALYGLQVDDKYENTTFYNDIGCAMHESQSRFLENNIGRRKSFWKLNYPKIQSHFPILKDVSLDDFMKMVNKSECSLIRTEADELTYPIHILIRYELEKEMFDGNLDIDNLNTIWADKYEEYLGVRPENDKVGVLQDMHWSAANLGYFPTYALGSAFAAQFYSKLEKDMNVDEVLEKGEFEKISKWLKENIHHYGCSKEANEILKEVTGEEFNVDYYINYLTDKYTKLYNL